MFLGSDTQQQRPTAQSSPAKLGAILRPRWLLGLLALLALLAACEQDATAGRPLVEQFEVSPLSVTAGQRTTFTWSVSASAAATCTLDVDGDGAADYTPECASGTQQHTYDEAGTFTATLEVTDGSGRNTRSVQTEVTPDDAGGGSSFSQVAWRPSTAQPYGVAEAQGIAVGGKLYTFGGFDRTKSCCTPTDRAYVFDPAAATWRALAPMPPMNGTEHGGVTHAGIASDGQDIFLAGGYTASVSGRGQIFGTREVWRYSVAENRYSRLPDLPVARAAGQLEYASGRLYFFGGTNQPRTEDTGNLYQLNLAAGASSWQESAPLPNARNHLGSAVVNGKIYAVAGQHDHDGDLTTQADVHVYDPATDSWQTLAPLPKAVSHNANSTFAMDGRIIVVGGEVAHLKPLADVFAYDPSTDSWSSLTPLPLALQSAVAREVGGQIVVTGGSGGGWRAETYLGQPLP